MSYILDSLRRAERERKAANGPELSDLYSPSPPPSVERRSKSAWIAGMIILNLLFLAGLVYYLDQRHTKPGPSAGTSSPDPTEVNADGPTRKPSEPVFRDRAASASKNGMTIRRPTQKSPSAAAMSGGGGESTPPMDDRPPSTIPSAQPATELSHLRSSTMSPRPAGTDRSRAAPSQPESEAAPSALLAARPAVAPQDQDVPDRIPVKPLPAPESRPEERTGVSKIPTGPLGPPQSGGEKSAGSIGSRPAMGSTDSAGGPNDVMPGSNPSVAANRPSESDAVDPSPIDEPAAPSTRVLHPKRGLDAPPFRELPPGLKEQFGHLALNVLVYYDDPDRCRAYINFHGYRIGDTLPDVGLRVEGISPDGVILNYGDGRFKLQTKR